MDLTYFPYDEQSCYIRFTNWNYGPDYINYTLSEQINLDYYVPNGLWDLHSISWKPNVISFIQTVEVTLVLRRQPKYFLINIILPTVSLSILSVLVFLIDLNDKEKLSVSVTILMSYSVILILISSNVPRNGKLPIISKYINFITYKSSVIKQLP